ncbi:unnamed protein product [Heterobilharzia americana]|nr:unnamed protein product [Heterobilharzia americana]
MNQCEDFTDLLNNLQYLINELKRHISIQTYMKCCYSENSLDLINDDRCAIVHPQHSKSWISDTRVKLSTLMNQPSNINHTNLKSYVESLRRTHYKLRQLSGRMDQLCSKFIHQCNKQFTCQSKLSTTDCLQQTADLLGTVIKRLHVIFDRSDVYVDNSTTQDVFQDLNKVLDNIAYYSSTINS